MDKYLKETRLLDYTDETIQKLIREKNWSNLSLYEKIKDIYNYVKDDILFGYNASDDIKASQVLKDGYGQCNTKATLFMALLRAVGVKCRFHGFTINKELQKGALTKIAYTIAPKEIIHSWVEVYYNNQWFNMEGLIIDNLYLRSLQKRFNSCTTNFCGYGVATEDLNNPTVEWNENHTYIQSKGIKRDFGLFDSPDDFYGKFGANLSGIKAFLYKNIIRHLINRNIINIRNN